MSRRVVGVAGATNQIGHFLLPRLVAAGHSVHAISRRPPGPVDGSRKVVWHRVDLGEGLGGDPRGDRLPGLDTWMHLAHLNLLPPLVPTLAARGVRRIVAFGSTSRFCKRESPEPCERELVAGLIRAEEDLARACAGTGIAWTLFRPTLIYGCGRDKNITTIARFVDRFGVFPLPGGGRGLRQPVHADDLAAACLAVLDCRVSFGRAYDLVGGETLSYRRMVARIFRARGRKPRFVPVPLPLLRGALRLAARVPGYDHLNPAMAERMNRDLCFDASAAARDFGYRPRGFEP